MEYCAVGSVSDAMNITNRTLTEEQIATVCRDILNGLDYLETNRKIHRDIKPHNILLNSKGEAKIGTCFTTALPSCVSSFIYFSLLSDPSPYSAGDFGIAQEISESGTQRKTVIGTPFYLAPEVIQEVGYGSKVQCHLTNK
jgi:serine/threonine protein kinase